MRSLRFLLFLPLRLNFFNAKEAPRRNRKERKEIVESPGSGGHSPGMSYVESTSALYDLQYRVAAIEEALGLGSTPQSFIGSELRPDLAGGPVYEESTAPIEQQMAKGDRDAKRQFDTISPR